MCQWEVTEANHLLAAMGLALEGSTVITSSSYSQHSQEGNIFCGGHGAFACALIQGFKGAADLDHDGFIGIKELFEYTQNRVKLQTEGILTVHH